MLLSSHGNHKVILRGRNYLANEDAMNLYPAQKSRDGHEDLAERQPLMGQACLHRRSSDFGPKLQSTMRSEKVVMASQQVLPQTIVDEAIVTRSCDMV